MQEDKPTITTTTLPRPGTGSLLQLHQRPDLGRPEPLLLFEQLRHLGLNGQGLAPDYRVLRTGGGGGAVFRPALAAQPDRGAGLSFLRGWADPLKNTYPELRPTLYEPDLPEPPEQVRVLDQPGVDREFGRHREEPALGNLRAVPNGWSYKLVAVVWQTGTSSSFRNLLEKTWREGLSRDSWSGPSVNSLNMFQVVTQKVDPNSNTFLANTLGPGLLDRYRF
jgi:hypothetical protein